MKYWLSLVLILSIYSCKDHRNADYVSGISTLPNFDILLTDSLTMLHARDIPAGKPAVFIYFRPDCPHCQLETKMLLAHIDEFKNYHLYFLTGASVADTRAYVQLFHLDQYPGIITIGKDQQHSFAKVFRPSGIPLLAIYNSDKKLVKVYYGEITVDRLITSLRS